MSGSESGGQMGKHGFFSRVSELAKKEVLELAEEHSYVTGQVIVSQEEVCSRVDFIVSGWVRLARLSVEGREQVMMRLGPGEVINLVPSLDGMPSYASAEAMTEVSTYRIDVGALRDIMASRPEVGMAVLLTMARRVRQLEELAGNLSLGTVEARLAKLLLSLASREEAFAGRMTRGEMAADIGTVREVVARTLAQLADEGVIRFDRHRIVIVRRGLLEMRATI